MGMDLIGAGFTVDISKTPCDLDAINALIDGLTDEQLNDDEFLNRVDPSDYLTYSMDEEEDIPRAVRDGLKVAATEYERTVAGHRMTADYQIPETSLWFFFAGGGSWGDDPYDGWNDLCIFTNFCEVNESIAHIAGYVSGGLPHPDVINGYYRKAND